MLCVAQSHVRCLQTSFNLRRKLMTASCKSAAQLQYFKLMVMLANSPSDPDLVIALSQAKLTCLKQCEAPAAFRHLGTQGVNALVQQRPLAKAADLKLDLLQRHQTAHNKQTQIINLIGTA